MGHNHHHVYPDEIGLKSPLKLDYTDPLMRMGVANTYLFGGNISFYKISLIFESSCIENWNSQNIHDINGETTVFFFHPTPPSPS